MSRFICRQGSWTIFTCVFRFTFYVAESGRSFSKFSYKFFKVKWNCQVPPVCSSCVVEQLPLRFTAGHSSDFKCMLSPPYVLVLCTYQCQEMCRQYVSPLFFESLVFVSVCSHGGGRCEVLATIFCITSELMHGSPTGMHCTANRSSFLYAWWCTHGPFTITFLLEDSIFSFVIR